MGLMESDHLGSDASRRDKHGRPGFEDYRDRFRFGQLDGMRRMQLGRAFVDGRGRRLEMRRLHVKLSGVLDRQAT